MGAPRRQPNPVPLVLLSSLVNPDGIPQAKTGLDIRHASAQVPVRLSKPVLDAAQSGPFDQPLLVEHPTRRRLLDGPGPQPAQPGRGSPGRQPCPDAGHRHPRSAALPRAGTRPQAQSRATSAGTPGEAGHRLAPSREPVPQPERTWRSRPHSQLHAESRTARPRRPRSSAGPRRDLYRSGRPWCRRPSATPRRSRCDPLARSENPARPAKRNDVGRVEPVPVVEAKIPVRTLDSRIRRPRSSEGDSHNSGDRGQSHNEVLHDTSIPQLFLSRFGCSCRHRFVRPWLPPVACARSR